MCCCHLPCALQSLSKSRDSLLQVLQPSVRFIQQQQMQGRTVLLVCEDSQLMQVHSSSTHACVHVGSHSHALLCCCLSVSYISCICAAAIVSSSISGAAAGSISADAAAAPAALNAPAPSARSLGVDKQRIRSALTVVKCHLPQHFPSRLLLKQLNAFFLSLEP